MINQVSQVQHYLMITQKIKARSPNQDALRSIMKWIEHSAEILLKKAIDLGQGSSQAQTRLSWLKDSTNTQIKEDSKSNINHKSDKAIRRSVKAIKTFKQ